MIYRENFKIDGDSHLMYTRWGWIEVDKMLYRQFKFLVFFAEILLPIFIVLGIICFLIKLSNNS